jgi:hypothetical protein
MSIWSDHRDEFVECGCTAKSILSCVYAEFVVAAAKVLDERVTLNDHRLGAVRLQAAHRPQPCFQPAVITLNPVVRILDRVVQRPRQQLLDHVRQRRGPVGDDLFRFAMHGDRDHGERARRGDITPGRDEHVDDLAVSVDSSVHVASHAGNFDIGLVDEPAPPDGMAKGSRRVDQQRCEPLHPAVQREVVDLDAAFPEQFFQVSV